MPNLDGTGPRGQGPRTGQKQGNCKDNNSTQLQNRPSRGLRDGSGRGRGLGRGLRDGSGRGRGLNRKS